MISKPLVSTKPCKMKIRKSHYHSQQASFFTYLSTSSSSPRLTSSTFWLWFPTLVPLSLPPSPPSSVCLGPAPSRLCDDHLILRTIKHPDPSLPLLPSPVQLSYEQREPLRWIVLALLLDAGAEAFFFGPSAVVATGRISASSLIAF
jgi:hypothetical protein